MNTSKKNIFIRILNINLINIMYTGGLSHCMSILVSVEVTRGHQVPQNCCYGWCDASSGCWKLKQYPLEEHVVCACTCMCARVWMCVLHSQRLNIELKNNFIKSQ